MKVMKAVDRDEVDNTHRDIFEGGQVVMNPLIDGDDSESYRFNVVNFQGEAHARSSILTRATRCCTRRVARGSSARGTRRLI